MHPKITGIEQFTSIELADYYQVRLKEGASQYTLSCEMLSFRNFWKWLIEDRQLPLNNPVRAFQAKRKGTFHAKKGALSLEDINRLIDACIYVYDKRVILGAIKGTPIPCGTCRGRIKEAAASVGLIDFQLPSLKLCSTNRLTEDIVQAYCDKILDTLPFEPKPDRRSLRTIKSPPFDKGTAVCNSDNDLAIVSRVD